MAIKVPANHALITSNKLNQLQSKNSISKIYISVKEYNMNYCKHCDEIYFHLNAISKLRHDTHSEPVEQKVEVRFCPECGKPLSEFKGFINERMYG